LNSNPKIRSSKIQGFILRVFLAQILRGAPRNLESSVGKLLQRR
jgi:hypothetical protein